MQDNFQVSCGNNIKYEGNAKISICKDDKILRTISVKNAGRFPLFQFITECLLGNYRSAELKRPITICAFSADVKPTDGNTYIPTINEKNPISNYATYDNKVTFGDIAFASVPEVYIDSNGDGYAEITYTFKIPFVQMAIPLGKNVNLIALYSRETRQSIVNPNAYIWIPDEEEPTKLGGLLSDAELNNGDNVSYNVLIKWTLRIGNK